MHTVSPMTPRCRRRVNPGLGTLARVEPLLLRLTRIQKDGCAVTEICAELGLPVPPR